MDGSFTATDDARVAAAGGTVGAGSNQPGHKGRGYRAIGHPQGDRTAANAARARFDAYRTCPITHENTPSQFSERMRREG